MDKGKLIVIDGGDGAGKRTQTQLLVERLKANGYEVETLDFPQYENNHFGQLIRECLDGERGDFLALDPKIASTLYAADRFESRGKIEAWLEAGKIVVLDRYVSSNMLHQGGKISDQTERIEFIAWLDKIEHEVFGVPRPDLIIYCSVAPQKRLELAAEKNHLAGRQADVAEVNLAHQQQTDAAAEQLMAQMNNWRSVECMVAGELRKPEDIGEEIFEVIIKVLT